MDVVIEKIVEEKQAQPETEEDKNFTFPDDVDKIKPLVSNCKLVYNDNTLSCNLAEEAVEMFARVMTTKDRYPIALLRKRI
jgi:hypothetical protein